MAQDFSGFLDCVKSVSVSDVAGGKACMVQNGYDANVYTVEQAITLAKSQLAQEIDHSSVDGPSALLLILALVVVGRFAIGGLAKAVKNGDVHGRRTVSGIRSAISPVSEGLNRWNIHNDTYRYFS